MLRSAAPVTWQVAGVLDVDLQEVHVMVGGLNVDLRGVEVEV